MAEEFLDELTVKDYTGEPRKPTQLSGQKSAVSLVDIQDHEDMSRVGIIDRDPKVRELMKSEEGGDELATDEELLKWCQGDREHIIFAIRGSDMVGEKERDKLQGWVYVYPEDTERLKKMRELDIMSLPPSGTPIFEISYAKLPGAAKGQIASGVRQASLMLSKELKRRDPERSAIYEKEILITAYVDPLKNKESVRVLENCGFVKVGAIKYDETEKREDDVYVLDWKKLREKLGETAFSELKNS